MSDVELPFDLPLDQPARDRIAGDLGANLFIEAGAGAGKTASLVSRIVALVHDGVDIGSIAAITFTEKAAAELRHRVRTALADADVGRGPDFCSRRDNAMGVRTDREVSVLKQEGLEVWRKNFVKV